MGIFHDYAISGVNVAKRTKHHLIASIMFLLKIRLRRFNRRREFFNGDDDEYNNALEYLYYALRNSYGGFLCTLGSTQLKIVNSQYSHLIKASLDSEVKVINEEDQVNYEIERKARTLMSMDELLDAEREKIEDERRKKQ